MFAGDVAVLGADGVGGREGVIGELEILRDLAHQIGRSLPVRQLLAQEGVEHGAGGVAGLEIVLNVERGENIVRVGLSPYAGPSGANKLNCDLDLNSYTIR